MFGYLVASNTRGRRDVRGAVLGMFTSITFQAAVTIGALHATRTAPGEGNAVSVDTIITLHPLPEVLRPQERRLMVVTPLRPLQRGFTVVNPPSDMLTEIPPVDPGITFDPRNYTGVGIEGGVFDGMEGRTQRVDDLARTYEHRLDQLPERISCPEPAYPRMARQANIQGQVLLRFIVETDGQVLPEHIETLSSSHRAFEGPAREMISMCLFRPGRVGARPVRVLVQMPVVFALAERG